MIPKSIRKLLKIEEGQRLLIEPLPADPYKVLGEVVGRPYEEKADEKRAEKWLRKILPSYSAISE